MSHQIADVYDQAHGSDQWFWINKMLIPDLMAIVDLKERTIRFDFLQLTKLIQNFSTYILSDTKKIHIGPIIYQVGAEDPLQPRLLFKPCFGVSLQVKIDPCRHHLHFSYPS